MKINKKHIFISISILAVSFLAYCFYPIVSYKEKNSPQAIILYDRNGIKITDKANKYGYKLKLTKKEFEEIKNSDFVKSLIKIEDKNFYNNFGINILSKLRAIKDNLTGKKISGASTITEQFIKNKYFLGQKRTYLQKAREAVLALYFSFRYSKDEILQKYLDNIFMGNNLYGVKTASKIYFNKNIKELNPQQITILLSLINYPSTKSLKETSFVKYFNKVKQRLGFSFKNTITKLNKLKPLDKFPFVTQNNYPKIQFIPISLVQNGYDITNKVSIDSTLQEYSKEIINNTLKGLKDKNVTNASVFAIIPKTGEILIYVGSKNFYATDIDGQVDVIKAPRQPGSTMKPFLYLLALQNGFSPDSLVIDIESEYNSFKNNKKYISQNYSLKEYGIVRLKEALGNSLNNASVRLAKELGLQKVYNFYKKYSFKLNNPPEYYGYSLVLGNPSIKLKDLVKSYAKLLPKYLTSNTKEQLEIEQAKFLLYDILSNPDNRGISFGVNSILNTSIPMAVKTGTSSDFRDNLVISYHPDLVLGVWVGNNDNSSMKGVTGITGAGYIWHQIIEKAIELGYIKDKKLKIPNGIIQAEYCLDKECFRKQLIYKKKNTKYYSRIKDNYYSKKDLKENLSDYEIERLRDLGFELRE